MEFYLKMAIAALARPAPYYWPTFYTEAMHASGSGVELPRDLFPVFHRAYDWHSCVHGFWCIARILHYCPEIAADIRIQAKELIEQELTSEKLAGELRTLLRPEFSSFERPYGLAWLCKLAAELHTWTERPSPKLRDVMNPLAELAAERIITWHERLPYPIQTGEHNQSAFGIELVRDFATAFNDGHLLKRIDREITRLYAAKSLSILHAEPSGHDFLSPSLARAMVVRHVLSPVEFAAWLRNFFPTLRPHKEPAPWLAPAIGHDAADGKLSHLIGLNYSRAWMIKRIRGHLPKDDGRLERMRDCERLHISAAQNATSAEHFASSHWLATFATLSVTDSSDG